MEIQELRAKQAALKKLQEELKVEKARITAANTKHFTAITTGVNVKQSLTALHEQAVALNQPDITLSGKVDGVEGTVSIRVRYGDVLKTTR